ncbi:MAG: hypothetical protein K6D02_02190 [Lachnospiraceae bacterium]|nr:hypothetical protein [Lachnospiraceae bacterium]
MVKVKDILNFELQDDENEYGGIPYANYTVNDYIHDIASDENDVNRIKSLSIVEFNDILTKTDSGINVIKDEEIEDYFNEINTIKARLIFNIKPEIEKMLQRIAQEKDISTTYYLLIPNDKHNDDVSWGIAFGWCDDFDNEPDSKFHTGTHNVCVKVGYNNSILKDYEYDWIMPSDEYGNVYDTEITLSDDTDIDNLTTQLIDDYMTVKNYLINKDIDTDISLD